MATNPPPPPADLNDAYQRLFLNTNNIYEPLLPLGKLGVVKNNRVSFIDKTHLAQGCTQQDIDASKIIMLPPQPVQTYVLDNKSSGSIGLFVLSANLSDEERYQSALTDVATVQLDPDCQLGVQEAAAITDSIAAAKGATIIYITNALVSHLVTQKFSETKADAGASIGSFLSVGGKYYKGEGSSTSLPLISVYGYQFQQGQQNWQAFSKADELGLGEEGGVIDA